MSHQHKKGFATPVAQTATLGVVFFLVFTAYTSIQSYASSTYGERLASDSCSAIYLTFAVGSLFAPGVTNRLGPRCVMSLGILGYVFFVLCSLLFFVVTTRQSSSTAGERDDSSESEDGSTNDNGGPSEEGWLHRFCYAWMILGGAVLGCGAALLWTAQGRLILEYARVAGELEGRRSAAEHTNDDEEQNDSLRGEEHVALNITSSDGSSSQSGKSKTHIDKTGTLFGIFWAIFQLSALVGGMVSFVCYSAAGDDDNVSNEERTSSSMHGTILLYLVFLGFLLAGALATQLLLSPSTLLRVDAQTGRKNRFDCSFVCWKKSPLPEHERLNASESCPILGTKRDKLSPEHEQACAHHSWVAEAVLTFGLFRSKPMCAASLLFFYTGFVQPYQSETFGNRFFNRKTIGLEMVLFYSAEIVSGLIVGRFLDSTTFGIVERDGHHPSLSPIPDRAIANTLLHGDGPPSGRRQAATRCLLIFAAVTVVGNFLALSLEWECSMSKCETSLNYDQLGIIHPTTAYALWGFSDGQIQTYSYWLIGALHSKAEHQARAVGFFKSVQSIGWCVGFYTIPTDRMSPLCQLLTGFLLFGVGTMVSLVALPGGTSGRKEPSS